MWLAATLDGLSMVPLSQVVEVPETRDALQLEVLGGLARPLIMVRVGWQAISRSQLPRTPATTRGRGPGARMNRRWVLACAAAEALGMAASAGAARAAGATGGRGRLLSGTCRRAHRRHGTGPRSRPPCSATAWTRLRPWVLATVLVAGLGWAAGSAPATLAGDTGGNGPPLLADPARRGRPRAGPRRRLWVRRRRLVMRNHVRHPWRWVIANALGLGPRHAGDLRSAPQRPVPPGRGRRLVGYGALTGAVAGAALGAVTGAWLPALDRLSVSDRQGLVAARDEGPSGAGPDAVTATSAGP